MKRDFTRKKRRGGKLDYRWQGPYVITASLGKGLFRLKETNGERVSTNFFFSRCIANKSSVVYIIVTVLMHTSQVIDRVNGFHLKLYYPPNPGKVGDPADSLHGDLTDPATDISNSDVSDRADSPAGNISDSDVHNGDVGDPAEESSTSTYAAGFTSSSPATKGGFFPDFFPDEDTFHRQPSPINHLIVENGSICLQPPTTFSNHCQPTIQQ